MTWRGTKCASPQSDVWSDQNLLFPCYCYYDPDSHTLTMMPAHSAMLTWDHTLCDSWTHLVLVYRFPIYYVNNFKRHSWGLQQGWGWRWTQLHAYKVGILPQSLLWDTPPSSACKSSVILSLISTFNNFPPLIFPFIKTIPWVML